jgi:fatty acid desaturase (delta-4 desaturase)
LLLLLPLPQVLLTELTERDWCEQQVLASANWGGHIANFFTGGLNLQVGVFVVEGWHRTTSKLLGSLSRPVVHTLWFAPEHPAMFSRAAAVQIEHHLFPAISFVHYPAIARVVRDECK